MSPFLAVFVRGRQPLKKQCARQIEHSVNLRESPTIPPLMLLARLLFLLLFCLPPTVRGAGEFVPDPRTVQRYGPAYRYPQAGWIVLHIEGDPHERGVQHGRLLAPEIEDYVKCLAAFNGPKSPTESWKATRSMVDSLFLRGYTREQLEEMKGIAEGASAAGARYDGRKIDLLDIAALNSANEYDSLDNALANTPTGLEGMDIKPQAKPAETGAHKKRAPRPQRCSAFAATGPATKDGKIVFGQITMFDLYPANFYNIWIDLKPTKGHRFVMQSSPGGIHSGMDYSISDAGILMTETTLSEQSGFDPRGSPLASRIRKAIQYANSIDEASDILRSNGNGLCSTEWILGDVKTNEIALLTLGMHQSKLYRSSKKEWFGGAEGFYYSCNNTKDTAVRLEAIAGLGGRPSPLAVFVPSNRDSVWLRMYERYKGNIGEDFALKVLGEPELVSAFAVDAKYTTSEMASKLQSAAMFGPPVGGIWQPSFTDVQKFPEIRPLVSNPWARMSASPPPARIRQPGEINETEKAADLHDPNMTELPTRTAKEAEHETTPAWHGTLLPETDADLWLSTGFANYERIVALENALRDESEHGLPGASELRDLGVELSYYRSIYELGARSIQEMPLAQIRSTPEDENPFRIASGKGVLLLHSLRGVLGEKDFSKWMDEFGRAHAGQSVTSAQFQHFMEGATGRDLHSFFDPWLHRTSLPKLSFGSVETRKAGGKWATSISITRSAGSGGLGVPVTVETDDTEVTKTIRLAGASATIEIQTETRPTQVVMDKYGYAGRGNGGPFNIFTFESELGKCLIVYGSLDEQVANAEAAKLLQHSVRRREHNISVPIMKDTDITEDAIKSHHLLLIGRPATNAIVERFRHSLPVSFDSQSFEAGGEVYAHPESAVAMAAENPLNRRYSLVVIAGLSAAGTIGLIPQFEEEGLSYAEVVVVPNKMAPIDMTVPPKGFVREVK